MESRLALVMLNTEAMYVSHVVSSRHHEASVAHKLMTCVGWARQVARIKQSPVQSRPQDLEAHFAPTHAIWIIVRRQRRRFHTAMLQI